MPRNRWSLAVVLVLIVALFWQWQQNQTPADQAATRSEPALQQPARSPQRPPAQSAREQIPGLPAEAMATIALIGQGGPFPHRQDGSTFGNREGRLPSKPRGWYREYTVDTPGLNHRGARRIVTGGNPPEVWYYTDDHYDSFRRFEVPR